MMIPRDILDRELADFEGLTSSVQLAQERVGFRLQRVREGSFLSRAGLRPNDLLLRVDGRPLTTIDDCAAAYAQVRVLDRFTVDVVRDGRPVQLRYVVGAPDDRHPLTYFFFAGALAGGALPGALGSTSAHVPSTQSAIWVHEGSFDIIAVHTVPLQRLASAVECASAF
jgi:hypothetical protein